jgi:predicted transcriptional regulator
MNRSELRAEIARKNISKSQLAKSLDLSPASLYLKLKGEREFKESEIQKLIAVLELTANDVNRIFLI